jgi:Tfp pilus assembly PilM family ATPase
VSKTSGGVSSWLSRVTRSRVPGFTAFDFGRGTKSSAVTIQLGKNSNSQPKLSRALAMEKPLSVAALRDLSQACTVSGHSAVALLARGKYRILTIDTPLVLPAEMDRAIRLSIAPQVDFPIESASVVWFPMPRGLNQSSQITVVACEQSVTKQIDSDFRSAGIALEVIDARETAQRNLSALFEKGHECLAMIHAEPEGLCLTFTRLGKLYLDRFIAQSLTALSTGSETDKNDLFDRVATQIKRSIDFVQRYHPNCQVERLLVVPSEVAIDFAGALKSRLELEVLSADLSEVLDLSDVPHLRKPEDQTPFFAAVGAALRVEEEVEA